MDRNNSATGCSRWLDHRTLGARSASNTWLIRLTPRLSRGAATKALAAIRR